MSHKKWTDPIITSLRINREIVEFAHEIDVDMSEMFILGLITHVENCVADGSLSHQALADLNQLMSAVIAQTQISPKYVGFRYTPEYRAWSGAVKFRDGMKCRKCGSTKKVEAHHIKNVAERPDLRLDIENGISLCKYCHKGVHADRISISDIVGVQ